MLHLKPTILSVVGAYTPLVSWMTIIDNDTAL